MSKTYFSAARDRQKTRRVVLQVVFLLVFGFGLWFLITQFPRESKGAAPTRSAVQLETRGMTQRDKGFVALSYFGVAKEATETVISQARLEEHLQALYDRGYVTISQQDLYGYYYEGKALPERAFFLFFEDGLKRSATLAQPILEKLGYKASMLSYGNNLEKNDDYFLSAEDLLDLEASGYWEIGVNGYRLSYINVFDRHDNYLGEMTPSEFRYVSPYLRRFYNHYLMDYLRDKYSIPMETQEQMAQRIQEDYRLMESVYTAKLGKLPMLYSLMHANTGQFATNNQVSAENERCISALFSLNFNREMLCLNNETTNPLDLTRMQPQAYWSVNHLLMRIADDTDAWQNMVFVTGDVERASQWEIQRGVAQWDGNTVRVTTLPEGDGAIRFKESETLQDFYLSVYFEGNLMSMQALDILSDREGTSHTAVELEKNVLYVYTSHEGVAQEPVVTLNLDELDGVVYPTMEENRQEAMTVEIDVKTRQTYKPDESLKIAEALARDKAEATAVNNEPYIEEITLKDGGSRYVEVMVSNGRLYVSIDHKLVVSDLELTAGYGGGWALRAAWSEYGYSQRNLADDVYDANFRDFYACSMDGTQVYADYRTPADDAVEQEQIAVKTVWQHLLDWLGVNVPIGGKE